MVHELTVDTRGKGLTEITGALAAIVGQSAIPRGLCTVFIRHTSASLLIQENADPDVRRDLEAFFSRLVPEGDPLYTHVSEGPDDMPAHVRSAITQTSISIPIIDSALALGTWQGVYVWEHRSRPHRRGVVVHLA